MKSLEKEGKTVDAAIDSALAELNVSAEEVDIEIIRKEGLFKTACVKVTLKQTKEDKALDYVSGLINHMNLETSAELVEDESKINLVGEDNGIAIGYRGEVLDAIQYLTCLAVNKGDDDYKKIVVDAENYRDKRKKTLENLAHRLADKALKTGRAIEVEPMNPYERKIVHSALSDNDCIKTESEGTEPHRYIVIIPLENQSGNNYLNDFSRKGLGKIRSFGNKKRRF